LKINYDVGTIYTASEEIKKAGESVGGEVLPI
jgi:hypothetical protein